MEEARWGADTGHAPGGGAVLDALLARYREPHRRYHGEAHVRQVVAVAQELLAQVWVADAAAVRLAAWYHDAIYDPAAPPGRNEADSAALAASDLGSLGVEHARILRVAELVRRTADHVADGSDAAVLLDADLAVLAADPQTYERYVAGVRAEYAHVPDDAWRIGRGAVLDGLLARERLYVTAPASCWEKRARRNLATERERLGHPPS